MEMSVFWEFNLAITALTQPLVWRYVRMRQKIKPMTAWEFIKVVGGSFVPFLNLGMLRMYMEPMDRTFQVCNAVIKTCKSLDVWLKEQDENGHLLMAMMSTPAVIYFPVDKKLLDALRYEKVQGEFWRYMGIYCGKIGYHTTYYAFKNNEPYLEIHVGG